MTAKRLTRFTIFTTPILNSLLRLASLAYLKFAGWHLEGDPPSVQRYVMIAAPHTSNWDLPMTLAIVFAFRLKVYYFAKHTLFSPPLGIFLRWLGAVSVDRSKSNNLVEQMIELFSAHERLILIIPPEGTRKHVRFWKSGFYHIAFGAHVPIALGFIDFRRKVAGIGGLFEPSGDYEADLPLIRAFYSGISGKNSQSFGVPSS